LIKKAFSKTEFPVIEGPPPAMDSPFPDEIDWVVRVWDKSDPLLQRSGDGTCVVGLVGSIFEFANQKIAPTTIIAHKKTAKALLMSVSVQL
jgi:hypothetical protein